MNSLQSFQLHREHIAGIPCDFLPEEQYKDAIRACLESDNLNHIVTLNAEMVVIAQQDQEFKKAIEQAQLIIPDSSGILWAREYIKKKTSLISFLFSTAKPLTGVDSIDTICKEVERYKGSAYLLGGEECDRKKTSEILKKKYTDLETIPLEISSELSFVNRGNSAIFVALGAPKQTLWIEENRIKLEQAGIRIAIGVGGAFAMISSRLPRAPFWMQRIHLEWLWRLILEPVRFKRIWNATVVFSSVISGYPH